MPGPPARRVVRHALGSSLVVFCTLVLSIPTLARATPRPPGDVSRSAEPAPADPAGNPLAGRPWGVYKGPLEHAWHAYRAASGDDKRLLGTIALRPKATWFGHWLPTNKVHKNVRKYVRNSQAGNPERLVQMAVFAIQPWEREACDRLPTATEREGYKKWVDKVAEALGNAHVAVILQPDAPFALCAPHQSKVLLDLMRYATERFGQQPNTSVYIEAGAADWMRDDPQEALKILIPAGIEWARGFALNSTHYDSTSRQIRFSAGIMAALAARGITDKHAVINTAQNGRPFKGYTYDGPNFDNARACQSQADRGCVTLGIPPTTDVANPAWGLSTQDAADAAAYVDGYLWFGRPWLYNQAAGWDQQRALTLARTTPFDELVR